MAIRKEDILSVLHPIQCAPGDIPAGFNDPFRYSPCPAVARASAEIISHIHSDKTLDGTLSEGKMLGVLIVEIPDDKLQDGPGPFRERHAYLAGFSGIAAGKNLLPGFVPPVLDLLEPEGHFKKEESVISEINARIRSILESREYLEAAESLSEINGGKASAMASWKEKMAESKQRRRRIRECLRAGVMPDSEDTVHYSQEPVHDIDKLQDALIRESQYEKACLKRMAAEYNSRLPEARRLMENATGEIHRLRKRRKDMSDSLQKWIFDNTIVLNACGERKSISEIFSGRGLVPPAGTGECAAPKLLQYAFSHGLRPLAMGEFWYGRSPDNEVREEGRFYTSCGSKCGPLLGFMMKGLGHAAELDDDSAEAHACPGIDEESIIYEDGSIIVADKPAGMLSVPGNTGQPSLMELLEESSAEGKRLGRSRILPVHRLDMDTSGIIIYAKTEEAQRNLRQQFEARKIQKTYLADLDIPEKWPHREGETGTISLPLAPDILDRPRQKADTEKGKRAISEYRILSIRGKRASAELHPLTGRTHQLRVHAAHKHGLGAPVIGDRLYGSAASSGRLHLHAASISFAHPVSGEEMHLESKLKPF